MRTILCLCLGALLTTSAVEAQSETPPAAQAETVTRFKQLLDNVRQKSGVHGIAVSIIESGKPAVLITSGVADTGKKTPVTAHTQFRFGSVSKILVAMSVMKLVEQGKLTLHSSVSELVPEIQFDNPYSADFPLTVQHLLNHATGWDAMHFAENVEPAANPVTIKQALEIHPDNRHSRWPPGSRSAYNNTGPLVAAYIIEKLSGMSYESFVKTYFLSPLNMHNTDYFYTDNYRQHAATLYLNKQPLAYEHMNNRAAGGLNSDIADMTALTEFLLTQGHNPQQQLLSASSFHMLQTPGGSLPAKAGIELTYAQGLNIFHANGYLLFGHEGSVRGGSALIVYQPDLQKGYVIAVNGEGPAMPQIHQFLADLITQPATAEPEKQQFSGSQQALSGFYRSISPTATLTAPFSVFMPWKLEVTEHMATISPLAGAKPRKLAAAGANAFSQWQTGNTVLVQANDPIAGAVIYYGPMTLQRIAAISAYAPIATLLIWALTAVIAVGFAFIWLPRQWLGKTPSHAGIRLRSWPLITLIPLLLAIALLLYAKASPALTELVGKVSWLSLGLMICSTLFLVSSLYSLVIWWQTPRRDINVLVYWHTSLLIALNGLVALFLLTNGLIGVRLWA